MGNLPRNGQGISAGSEVASGERKKGVAIKPTSVLPRDAAHVGLKIDGARADLGSVSLTSLILMAYKVEPFQLTGPDWMATTRFDILAKLPEGATKDQVPEMLRALLADRFQLRLRREPREQQVYALVPGRDGAKLKQTPLDFVVADTPFPNGRGGQSVLSVMQPTPPAGWQTISSVNGHLVYETKKVAMPEFARFLGRYTDNPVVDLTGLSGFYEVTLDVPSVGGRLAAQRFASRRGPMSPPDNEN
jgi:uncharacterized protein (TIGR03435 family)